MTELQETELELLKQFLLVCEQFKLTYYLVCGSALGAVKYGGFIPWDDDIDVALPRKDYEVFCREAPKMLPEWCFYKIIIQSLNIIFLGVSCATAELHI